MADIKRPNPGVRPTGRPMPPPRPAPPRPASPPRPAPAQPVATKQPSVTAKAVEAAPVKKKKGFRLTLFGGVKLKELTQFTVQFAVLQDAGLPIVRSLKILTAQLKDGTFKDTMQQVTDDVEAGSPLSEALAKFPKVFDKLYVSMVKAGEAGGVLDTILRRLADFMEKAQKLKRQIISASTYPAVVITVAILIVAGLMVKVVPKFAEVFKGQDKQMPQITQFLMDVSHFMGSYWFVFVAIPIVLVFALKFIKQKPALKYKYDAFMLKVPLIGQVISKSATARFTRTLGTLLASGVQILDAFDIIKDAIGNEVYAKAIADVRKSVKEGGGIAASMAQTKVFSPLVVNMVQVGEETGELDKMLIKIADNYDEEVESAVTAMMNALEPMMIVGIAIVVGFIVVALFMPLVTLMKGFSG